MQRPSPRAPFAPIPSHDRVAELFARVREVDPLLVEAVEDVDLSLLRASLRMSPLERLRASRRMASMIHGFRRVTDESR